ncbi:glutamate-rich protein 5 [Empedobacter falsenii]|uniref:glutamate-rich protein 5 n=1 Tax=Empedobacter falsenii TaxID=343874 RepID=UPI001C8DE3F5|nr:glutamate-rich protein 5 [Empedobacter falsenii]MBY0066319.1 glutamate-rich protein 5 [Empedobacter falsenii]
MNKVYKISNKISATTLILVAALGISSCSTYQPSGYESDGVYYNPKTDKTYQQAQPQYGNEQGEQENQGEIKIGSPYFDAEGNGAEQFYYQDDVDSTNDNTQSKSATKVKINGYGLGGYNYFGNNDYTLTYNGSSNYDWGRNDGVEINIWNNYPWYNYGWGGFYNPYRWGYYNPWYGGWYGNGFGISFGWGWNDPWYNGYYGWGWNRPYYGGYYGGYYGWNNGWGYGYGYPGYYGYGYNRPRGIYSQPGYRNGGRLNNTINSTRPIGSLNGRNNQISTGLRPTRDNTINTTTRPTREVRPGGEINSTRPTREVRPTVDQGQMNNTRPTREVRPSVDQSQINGTRPTREVRPTVDQGQMNNTRPTREVRPAQTQQPTYNTRPTREAQQYQQPTRSYDRTNSMNNSRSSYSTPSPSRGSSMSSGSMGGGSRGSSTGGGSRGGRR